MKFNLIIDPACDEQVDVRVRRRSDLTDAIEQLVLRHTGHDRIMAYTEDDMRMLRFDDIQLVFSMDGKTWAADGHNTLYRIKMRLYELEEMLPSCFIRINKSALANENHLMRFSAGITGAVNAVFRCGRTEYVSRRCYADIKRRYKDR